MTTKRKKRAKVLIKDLNNSSILNKERAMVEAITLLLENYVSKKPKKKDIEKSLSDFSSQMMK